MQYKIFTTVGTSIITNDNNIGNFDDFDDSSYYEHWESVKADFTTKSEQWLAKIKEKASQPNLSAEISSLLKIYDKLPDGVQYDVYLLCTDTLASAVCAWVVQQWFCLNKDQYPKFSAISFDFTEKHIVPKLGIIKQTNYEEGFMSLIKILEEKKSEKVNDEDKETKKGDILNITGGYKALIPILTLYGQLREMPLKYLYNEAELKDAVLVTVGNLPIGFEWEYIYYWELLIRKVSLEYISPIYTSLLYLEKKGLLKHNHLENQQEFKSLSLSSEEKGRITKIKKFLPIYKKMIEENVLKFDEVKNKVELTIIGDILQKYSNKKQLIGSQRMGALAELLFYKFFSIPPDKRKTLNTTDYVLNLNPTFEPTKFTISPSNEIIIGSGTKDAKDIDINLCNLQDKSIVLGECKTSWEFIRKSEKNDYIYQIKARILQQLKINLDQNNNSNLQFLFIVLNFELFTNLDFSDETERYNKIIDAAAKFELVKDDIQIKESIEKINEKLQTKIVLNIKTMLFKRKLNLNKECIIDWHHLFMEVDTPYFNEIVLL